MDNDTILTLHLELKRALESAEEKLEKSLELVSHGEMFERDSRQGFFEGVKSIVDKSVAVFAKLTKEKIQEYLAILNNSIGLQKAFDSAHFSRGSEQGSNLRQDYDSWGIGNLRLDLENFNESPLKKKEIATR